MQTVIILAYMVSAVLFIYGLKMLSKATTAVRGNLVSALGMAIAIVATILDPEVSVYQWIGLGIVVGGVIGSVAAVKVPDDFDAGIRGAVQRHRRSGELVGWVGGVQRELRPLHGERRAQSGQYHRHVSGRADRRRPPSPEVASRMES